MAQKKTKHNRKGRLDEQTLGYYRRVQQTLTDGFDDETDQKELFIQNVFSTLCTEAISVSQNQTASSIVEHLLKEASLDHLISFGRALSNDWELACTDRFASHVTQTFALQLGSLLSDGSPNEEAFSILTELYSFLMSNLAYHMQHTYTSHIVRVMIETLGGVRCSDSIIRSRVARQNKGSNVKEACVVAKPNKQFTPLLKEICDKIIHLDRIKDHIRNHLSNPVIQTVLVVLKETNPEKCKSVCRYFIQEADILKTGRDDENSEREVSLPELVQDEIGSHFIEQVIQTADEELFENIFSNHFLDKLLALAIHPTANYVLQKLIKCCYSSQQFEAIFKVLRHHLESILCLNHNQVIVCLAEGCNKHGTKQEKFTKALMKAFHCYSPEERQSKCVTLFASLTTYEVFYKMPSDDEQDSDSDEEKEIKYPQLTAVSLHGSLLLQQMLQFGNPKLVVTSLLNLKPSELRTMSCDPCGSHVIETFFTSPSIGEKSHDAFYLRMKGLYSDLACNKNGSRTLDAMFNAASIRHKFTIVEELNRHESKIKGDRFGRILWWNYNMSTFQRNKNEWKQRQLGEMKKRKLFQDLIGDNQQQKAVKKQKANSRKAFKDEERGLVKEISDEEDQPTVTSPKRSKKEKHEKSDLKKQHKVNDLANKEVIHSGVTENNAKIFSQKHHLKKKKRKLDV